MTSSSEILVLIANEDNGTLCANTDGATKLLCSIDRVLPVNERDADDECSPRRIFACELMMALSCGIDERNYDGVVIFAEPSMMDELRQVRTSAVSRALIAEVVGKLSDLTLSTSRSNASGQLASMGALQ